MLVGVISNPPDADSTKSRAGDAFNGKAKPPLADETFFSVPCQEFVACLSASNLLKLAREAGRTMTFLKIYLASTTPLPVLN